MNCPNCGAIVLKSDAVCKQCGHTLIEAADRYDASTQYRSRFTLLFKCWIGAWRASHLKWLGYTEKTDNFRRRFGVGFKELLQGGLVGSLFLVSVGLFKFFFLMMYHCFVCLGVILGMYRKDADGHPVRYFKPRKKKNKEKR